MNNHLHIPVRIPNIQRLDLVDLRTMPKRAEATVLLITVADGAEKRNAKSVKTAGTGERRYVVPALGLSAWAGQVMTRTLKKFRSRGPPSHGGRIGNRG